MLSLRLFNGLGWQRASLPVTKGQLAAARKACRSLERDPFDTCVPHALALQCLYDQGVPQLGGLDALVASRAVACKASHIRYEEDD